MDVERVVIVGAGQGGFETAAALRKEGFAGRITLIGDEPGLPYQRPPLSKGYMKDGRAERLALRPAAFYETGRIDRLEDARVARIDRARREVILDDGTRHGYDHLVLATGARNAVPPIEGAESPGVLGLRTLADADRLRARMPSIGHAIVIGGGFIGLEFAAVARAAGVGVTVVEAAERLMGRVVSPPISAAFEAAHRAAGARVLTSAPVVSIRFDGPDPAGVTLADGRYIAGDAVLLAAGIVPNTELAAEAGLRVENGVAVDARLLTSDPSISAIGDCASVPRADGRGRIRLEVGAGRDRPCPVRRKAPDRNDLDVRGRSVVLERSGRSEAPDRRADRRGRNSRGGRGGGAEARGLVLRG